VMAPPLSRTAEGFELQIGTNHLGHFALTNLLLASVTGRVVTVSSTGHRMGRIDFDDLNWERRPYSAWRAYGQSKLANLLFTAELHRRLTEAGTSTIALAAHPGGSATDLGTEGGGLTNRAMTLVAPLAAQPAEVGARPMLRALTDPAARGGEFYGPRFVFRGATPVIETPSRAARDAGAARRLWADSVEMTGLEPAVTR
jgi:NAD(P)-dependent dehydrogenase (short-subunit alcohol dehydrogenase family)